MGQGKEQGVRWGIGHLLSSKQRDPNPNTRGELPQSQGTQTTGPRSIQAEKLSAGRIGGPCRRLVFSNVCSYRLRHFLTACRKEAKPSFPLRLTGAYRLEGAAFAQRLAARRNHRHPCGGHAQDVTNYGHHLWNTQDPPHPHLQTFIKSNLSDGAGDRRKGTSKQLQQLPGWG